MKLLIREVFFSGGQGMREVSLQVEGDTAGDQTAVLRSWLLGERELRGQVTMPVPRPVDDEDSGTMGGTTLEMLNFAVSNAIALGSLITSVVAWRASRPAPAPSVRIQANGVSITINTDDRDTLHELTQVLQRGTPED